MERIISELSDQAKVPLGMAGAKKQYFLPQIRQPRLLIISDSADRLMALNASLNVGEVEITNATYPYEHKRLLPGQPHLAVVDVGPAYLVEVLKALRLSPGCAEIPILVEASRISAEPGLVGVLPQYRAMPCCRLELVRLAQRLIASTTSQRGRKTVL